MIAEFQKKGFTLAEIIVVLVIVGAIAAMALPRYNMIAEAGRAKEGEQILLNLLGAQKRFFLENNGTYADDFNDLDIEIFTIANFNAPAALDGTTGPDFFIGQIIRTGGIYTLSINADGDISCTGSAMCSKMGY